MKISTAAVLTSSGLGTIPESPPCGILPEPGPDWLILWNCALGGGGPRIDLALLHPRIGVAFVDLVADGTDASETNAVDRLRRALDSRRFPAIFGGYPPIVRVVLSSDDAAELGRLLTAAFDAEPPLRLAGGDAWIGTARAAIEAELPIVAPERLPGRRHRRSALLWRTAALAALGGVAAAVLLSVPLPPRRGPGGLIIRPTALVAPTAAPRPDPDLPLAAALIEDDLTAHDVAEALLSAEGLTVTGAAYAPPLPTDAPTSAIAAAVENVPETPPMDLAGQDAAPTAALSDTSEGAPPEEAPPGEEATAIEVAAIPELDDVPAGTDTAIQTETPPTATASIAAEPSTVEFAPAPDRAPEHVAAEPPPATHAAAYEPARPTAPQTSPATGNRRAALRASTAPPALDAGGGAARCREILVRATMEGTLSEGDRAFLRRGCQSPRS